MKFSVDNETLSSKQLVCSVIEKNNLTYRKTLGGCHVYCLLLSNNRQHMPVCAKTVSSLVRKVLNVAKAHMSPSTV